MRFFKSDLGIKTVSLYIFIFFMNIENVFIIDFLLLKIDHNGLLKTAFYGLGQLSRREINAIRMTATSEVILHSTDPK